MSKPNSPVDGGVIIRRALFFAVLLGLTGIHLLLLFRGLGTPQAMEQAHLGRQVARGEGFTTKAIRPLEHHLAEVHKDSELPLVGLKDTYHSPLNPIVLGAVFKLVGADQPDAFPMGKDKLIYDLDRVVALVSTLFFLTAMGVTYLLVCRIFDGKIAGVTVIMMMLCGLFWKFSQSGLPQMLLLLLFTCGLYFIYRTIEEQEEGTHSFFKPILAAIFFSLMVLTHWITIWIFFGFLVFAALAFRPRGIIALASLGVLAIAVAFPLYRMVDITGDPFGLARYVFYNGLSGGSEADIMRTVDLSKNPLQIDGLLLKIFGTTLVQATSLIPFLGGILAAPLFFVALLHPFKRKPIAKFRWLIALTWLFAAIGMAIFGIESRTQLHPNQIHILFAPIMAAYGLAFLSILWSRLNVAISMPIMRNAHLFVIVAFSAAPMLLTLPQDIRGYLFISDKGGWPQWPPYYPSILNLGLKNWVDNDPTRPEIVISDQPWAIAWYADTHSLWLPRSMDDFLHLENKSTEFGTNFSGILITPESRESGTSSDVVADYGDFAALVLDGRVSSVTGPVPNRSGLGIYERAPRIAPITQRFPYRTPLLGPDMIYYSASQLRSTSLQD
ncbi:MAG: ArnT family glycosyltransferase [Verrucomicrobiales bacterium]